MVEDVRFGGIAWDLRGFDRPLLRPFSGLLQNIRFRSIGWDLAHGDLPLFERIGRETLACTLPTDSWNQDSALSLGKRFASPEAAWEALPVARGFV